MKIAFIGAGNMATGLAKRLAAHEHEIMLAHSRDQKKLDAQARSIGKDTKTGTASEASVWADIIVLATPYQAAPDALRAAGDLSGKLLWSIINPLKQDFSGLEVGTNTSGAEELAKLAPNARFVAALPPFAEVLHASSPLSVVPSVFVCSDDESAKTTVTRLLHEIGADPVDGGALFAARFFEPALMGLVYLAYGRGMGARIGIHFIR